MKGSDTLGLRPEVKRGNVTEAHDPSGVSTKRCSFEKRKEPGAAITSAKRPNRTDIPSAETAVEDFSTVGVGAPELAISCIQPLRNHRPETRRLD